MIDRETSRSVREGACRAGLALAMSAAIALGGLGLAGCGGSSAGSGSSQQQEQSEAKGSGSKDASASDASASSEDSLASKVKVSGVKTGKDEHGQYYVQGTVSNKGPKTVDASFSISVKATYLDKSEGQVDGDLQLCGDATIDGVDLRAADQGDPVFWAINLKKGESRDFRIYPESLLYMNGKPEVETQFLLSISDAKAKEGEVRLASERSTDLQKLLMMGYYANTNGTPKIADGEVKAEDVTQQDPNKMEGYQERVINVTNNTDKTLNVVVHYVYYDPDNSWTYLSPDATADHWFAGEAPKTDGATLQGIGTSAYLKPGETSAAAVDLPQDGTVKVLDVAYQEASNATSE